MAALRHPQKRQGRAVAFPRCIARLCPSDAAEERLCISPLAGHTSAVAPHSMERSERLKAAVRRARRSKSTTSYCAIGWRPGSKGSGFVISCARPGATRACCYRILQFLVLLDGGLCGDQQFNHLVQISSAEQFAAGDLERIAPVPSLRNHSDPLFRPWQTPLSSGQAPTADRSKHSARD